MTRFTTTMAALLSISLATNACFAQPFAGEYSTEGLSGEPIPGTVSNELYSSFSLFEASLIDNLGRTTYKANTSTGDQVLVSAQQVAFRTGTQVVGAAAGTVYQLLNGVAVNDLNDIVMSAIFSGPPISSTNDFGLVQILNGTPRLVIQEGDSTGTPGETYSSFGSLRQNQSGDISLTSFLEDLQASLPASVLIDHEGGITIADREGAPGVGDEVLDRLSTSTVNTVSTNASRRVALYARKFISAIQQTERDELVLREIGALTGTVLVQTGDPFSILPGAFYNSINRPQLNNSNQAIYDAGFNGAVTANGLVKAQINADNTTTQQLVSKTGDPAIGGPAGFEFTSYIKSLINSDGKAAFLAGADAPPAPGLAAAGTGPTEGIWFEDQTGQLRLAGYNGQQAPDLPAGIELAGISFPSFNGLGQVAFSAALTETEFDRDSALFATDINGDLHLVVREGDLFDVDDDPNVEDLRTISAIAPLAHSGGEDGRSTSLNESGQLVMGLAFKDLVQGSFVFSQGIFVADLVSSNFVTDLDGDGDVDGSDFLLIQRDDPSLISQWQTDYPGVPGVASSQTVPEPASTAFAVLALACFTALGQRVFP